MHSVETKEKIASSMRAAWAAGKFVGTKNIGFRAVHRAPGYRQSDEVRARIAATLKEGHRTGRITGAPASRFTKGDGRASALRQAQLTHEAAEAQKLVDEGFEVYSPTVVCDRVAVKNGRVYFVEFKREGQLLRDAQRRVQELVPDSYLVRFAGDVPYSLRRRKKEVNGLVEERSPRQIVTLEIAGSIPVRPAIS